MADKVFRIGITAAMPAAMLGLVLTVTFGRSVPAWFMGPLLLVASGGLALMVVALLMLIWGD